MNDELPVTVFMSYDDDDDLALPDAEKSRGFITVLLLNLKAKFKSNRKVKSVILWDRRLEVSPAEQQRDVIFEALQKADVFLAVFSKNWIWREQRYSELESFSQIRQAGGEDQRQIRKRIIVVRPRPIAEDKHPPLMQGQEGYNFFDIDDDFESTTPGNVLPFFNAVESKFVDKGYSLAERIAGDILGLMTVPPPPSGGRQIYLAKSAADTDAEYRKLYFELKKKGYEVVPGENEKIPDESCKKATSFIDAALKNAEGSIHLLGIKHGSAPDGAKPIVDLQLEQAAKRVQDSTLDPSFRLIWAPKAIGGNDEEEPRAFSTVVESFGIQRQDSDRHWESDIETFSIEILNHLELNRRGIDPLPIPEKAKIFIDHAQVDTAFALQFELVLRKLKYITVRPPVQGNPLELEAWRREHLQDCEAIFLLWAGSPDLWWRIQTPKYRDVTKPGRERAFLRRALVAGPPLDNVKDSFIRLKPSDIRLLLPDEIDVVVDFTSFPPADLGDLLGREVEKV